MRCLKLAIALVALAVPAAASAQQPGKAPSCRASLDGDQLTTIIEFSDGYAVEAPWRVTWNRSASLQDGKKGVAAEAKLDRIVEVDPKDKHRVVTPFPEPIQTTFEGHSEQELVYKAAQIWCLTVLKAQEQQGSRSRQAPPPRKSPKTQTRTVGP
jgi:hypothetical protein